MAIARDANSYGTSSGATSTTVAHTITGSNTILFSSVVSGTTDDLTGVTYNGVAMTFLKKHTQVTEGTVWHLYALIAPTTGANNIVATRTGSTGVLGVNSESYTGVYQGGLATTDGVVSSSKSENVDDITDSITTVADNSWIISVAYDGGSGTTAAGTNNSLINLGSGYHALGDTNAAQTPVGSKSMQWTATGAKDWVMTMASFAPDTFVPAVTFIPRVMIF